MLFAGDVHSVSNKQHFCRCAESNLPRYVCSTCIFHAVGRIRLGDKDERKALDSCQRYDFQGKASD